MRYYFGVQFQKMILGDLKSPLILTNFRVLGAGLKLLRVSPSNLLFHICIGCIWRGCNYRTKLDLIIDIFVLLALWLVTFNFHC